MIQQQERAEKFFRAIRRDAERRRKQIISQIDEYIAAETEKIEQAELQSANERVQYETQRIQSQTNSQLAKETTEISAELAAYRSAITKEVFEQAAQKLAVFVKSQQYQQWLSDGKTSWCGDDSVCCPCSGGTGRKSCCNGKGRLYSQSRRKHPFGWGSCRKRQQKGG